MRQARLSRWTPAGTARRRSARPTGAWIGCLTPNSCASCRRDAVAGGAPALHDELAAAFRREHDRPAHAALRLRAGGADVEARDQLAQHHLDLELGEARAKTTSNAAAEWDPRVGAGRLLEEALRPERARLLVDVRPAVD